MDKEQALQSFWSSFGLPAYDENTVPEDASLPYITYEVATGSFENEIPLTASVFYKGSTWGPITQKTHEIAQRLYELRGSAIRIDDGLIRIWEGTTPLFQRMGDEDDQVRWIVVNVMVEFMTKV